MNKRARVLVTFDSMRYPNTGFFFFGKSLSKSLIEENDFGFDFSFYSYKSVPRNLYPPGIRIINKSVLHKLLFPHNFDLVHFSDQYCKPHPALVKGKKILTIHDINPYYDRMHKPAKLARYVNRLNSYIRNCDRIVAISNFVASEIERCFPISKGKISVIYNGADKLHLPEDHLPQFKPSSRFLFTIGMVSPKKNFHVLPCLLENNDLELIIAGIIKDEYKSKIMEEAKKYNCEARVKIIGTISDLDKAWYYKNCYAFMFPSLAEGFGLPVIEAMHFGKPVFLSTLTSLPEIGGDHAFYFRNFEPKHMRDVFNLGLEHYKNSKDFRGSVIERASLFHWKRTAGQYLNLYQQLLNV